MGDPLDVVGEFQGLGTLPADQLPGLLGSIGVEPSAVALSKSMEQAESGDPQDYVSFLKERNTFEKVKVAAIMAREGDYVTVESGKRLPPMPEGFVRIGQLRVGSVGGKKVDAYFIFDLSLPRNQAIKDTKSDWEQAEALLADEDVRAFNLQPLGVRQNKIKQHMAAMDQLNGVSGRSLSDEVTRRLQGQLLPRHFIVDQQHYIVTRLIRRRY